MYGGERNGDKGSNKDTCSEADDDDASLCATTPGDDEDSLNDFTAPATPDIDEVTMLYLWHRSISITYIGIYSFM